jgi:hypothetical protein
MTKSSMAISEIASALSISILEGLEPGIFFVIRLPHKIECG